MSKTARNDITGDKIQSRPTKISQEEWDRIFNKKRERRADWPASDSEKGKSGEKSRG